MIKLAYYISDYGYGHAARSIAVIRELLKRKQDLHITVCTSFTMDFLKRSLSLNVELLSSDSDRVVNSENDITQEPNGLQSTQERLAFRKVPNDIGFILKENSVQPDKEKFVPVYEEFIKKSDAYINQEMDFLAGKNMDIILSDIPPFPFEAANRLQIPSIGLSNFTWYTAYLDLISIEKLQPLREAYKKMTYFVKLFGCNEPSWAVKEEWEGGIFSREISVEKVTEIRYGLDPMGTKSIVYFGLGMKIGVDDLSALPIWQSPNCVFILSSNSDVEGDGIYKVPAWDTETQNYVAAADIVISKPGWSTVSEAITGDSALLIIKRSDMREDQNTIDYLTRHNACELVKWEDLKEWVIDQALIDRLKNKGSVPSRFMAVDRILDILDQC